MPIYEYRCVNGHEFEKMRPMSQMNEPAACPACGSNGQKLVSPFANSNLGVGIMIPKTVFRGTNPETPAAKAPATKAPAAKAPAKAPARASAKKAAPKKG
jgi:putative FmdB family regulatory protein